MTISAFIRVGISPIYEVPAGGARGWVAYLLPEGEQTSVETIEFRDTIVAEQSKNPTQNGHFLYALKRPPNLDKNPDAVADKVYKLLAAQQSSNRAVAWLQQKNNGEIEQLAYITQFLYKPYQGNIVLNNLNVPLGDNFVFYVGNPATVSYSDEDVSVRFGSRTQSVVGFTNTSTLNPGLELDYSNGYFAHVPLIGDYAGVYRFKANLQPYEAASFLNTGVQYLSAPTQKLSGDVGSADRRVYPLLEPLQTEHLMEGVLDPLDRYNAALSAADITAGFLRSALVFTQPDPIPSNLRTTTGKQISLSPRGNGMVPQAGGLVFMPTIEDPDGKMAAVQLTPVGDFGLQIKGIAAATPNQCILPGLFGSEFMTFTTQIEPGKGDVLRWRPRQPAYAPSFPFRATSLNNPASGSLTDRLTDNWLTSWATLVPGHSDAAIAYSAQPAGAPLYAESGKTPALLGSLPPMAAFPADEGFSVPFTPYAAYGAGSNGNDAGLFESQILSPTRKALISPTTRMALLAHAKALRFAAEPPKLISATTPQGLLAEVPDGVHGTYAKVTLAKPEDSLAPDFAFCNLTPVLTDALQTNQLFLVVVNPTNLGTLTSWDKFGGGQAPTCAPPGGEAQFLNTIDIADWTFVADIGKGALPTDYRNVMILKFCDGALTERLQNPNQWSEAADFSILEKTSDASVPLVLTGLSAWLKDFVNAGIAKSKGTGEDAELYQNFANMVQDPAWNGVLVLNADMPLNALPAQLAGIGAGIDPARFIGHHFGATVSRIKHLSGGKLEIDGVSALFGLIDYVDPAYAQMLASGGPPDTPIHIDTTDGYGFSVLRLQAGFAQAKLKTFRSRIQLSLAKLFGSTITNTSFNGVNQALPAVVLNGSAVRQNDKTVYVFEESKPYVFVTDTPALNAVSLNRVQFNTLDVGTDERVRSRFMMWGAFDFATLQSSGSGDGAAGPFDLLSFGSSADKPGELGKGLAFSNLQIDMEYVMATPSVVTWNFSPGALAFDLETSTLRDGSLAKAFSLQVSNFIAAPIDKTPADFGFLPVTPEGVAIARLEGPWYGINYKINMGTPGALVSAAGFSSNFMIAWAPEDGRGPTAPQIFPGLSLPGAAPAASAFSLQGVIKLSTGPIKLVYAPGVDDPGKNFYALRLENIGIKILGFVKLPPSATIQFFLFGDPEGSGSLGWWASYIQDDAGKSLQRIDGKTEAVK